MNESTTAGLTVRQPWANAIIHGGTDIENRAWTKNHHGPRAIHANASRADARAYEWCERLGADAGRELPRGFILGVVDLVDIVSDHDSPWAMPDNFHWVLSNPRPVEHVPYLGKLGMLNIPAEMIVAAPVAA